MKAPTACDEGVLNLLLSTDKKHVDYLVDVLTDEGQGRLALSSSIKDLLLEEKTGDEHYSEDALRQLLNELQAFGGHSVVNVFRKDPLSYQKLLTDVHNKLNGSNSKNKSVAQLEREIVLGLFGEQWNTLADHKRLERCTEMKVVSGFFKLEESLKIDNHGVAYGLPAVASAAIFAAMRLHPVTAVSSMLILASQSIGEAYRVTIPFVVQIAYIKMLSASMTATKMKGVL